MTKETKIKLLSKLVTQKNKAIKIANEEKNLLWTIVQRVNDMDSEDQKEFKKLSDKEDVIYNDMANLEKQLKGGQVAQSTKKLIKAIPLSKAEEKFVAEVISDVWGVVSYDMQEANKESGSPMTNEIAVECSIDADQLLTIGNNKHADDIVSSLYANPKYKFAEVTKYLSTLVRLV